MTSPTDPDRDIIDLSDAHASTALMREEAHVVTTYSAVVNVFTPAPGGGSYVQTVTCTHRHAADRREELDACRERLARILNAGRLPSWAKVTS